MSDTGPLGLWFLFNIECVGNIATGQPGQAYIRNTLEPAREGDQSQ